MTNDNEELRRTKDYILVKKYFEEDPEKTLTCIKERLIAHGHLINMYGKEAKKTIIKKEIKENWVDGIEEITKSGKMIAKWVLRLRKDFPEFDFSAYEDLVKIAEENK